MDPGLHWEYQEVLKQQVVQIRHCFFFQNHWSLTSQKTILTFQACTARLMSKTTSNLLFSERGAAAEQRLGGGASSAEVPDGGLDRNMSST
jgi:hypothetical protein